MTRILLYTIHDHGARGIRQLGAYLRENGHDVHLVMLGLGDSRQWVQRLPHDFFETATPAQLADSFSTSHTRSRMPITIRTTGFSIPSSFVRHIAAWQPDIIGYSGYTHLNEYFVSWFPAIRTNAPKAILIAGGPGPTGNPSFFLNNGVDAVIRGEGEDTLLDLAERISQDENWKKIDNVTFYDGKSIKHTPLRQPRIDLSDLPVPLFAVAGIYHDDRGNFVEEDPCIKNPTLLSSVLTGRGCMGNCAYCDTVELRKMYEENGIRAPRYRYSSVDVLISHLKHYKNLGAKEFNLEDDFFVRPYDELVYFFKQYEEQIDLPFFANLPVSLMLKRTELVDMACDAGLHFAPVPVQAADEFFVKKFFYRQNRNEDILKLMSIYTEKCVAISTDFIEGMEYEKEERFKKNLQFICEMPSFNPAFPDQVLIKTHLLRVHDESPLAKHHGDTVRARMSPKEYFYRSMMLMLRHTLADTEFEALQDNHYYKDNPTSLLHINADIKLAKHNKYVLNQAERLGGKKVYFWGCGEIYQARKHLFLGTRPQKILVDVPTKIREVDGLAVCQAKDVLASDEELPLVIFSNQALKIKRAIKKLRLDYPDNYIIACQTTH